MNLIFATDYNWVLLSWIVGFFIFQAASMVFLGWWISREDRQTVMAEAGYVPEAPHTVLAPAAPAAHRELVLAGSR